MGRPLYSSRPPTPIHANYELVEQPELAVQEQELLVEDYEASESSDSSNGANNEYHLEDPRAEAFSLAYSDSVQVNGALADQVDEALPGRDENLWTLIYQEYYTRRALQELAVVERRLDQRGITNAATMDALAIAIQNILEARNMFNGVFRNDQNRHLLQTLFYSWVPEIGPPSVVPTGPGPLRRRRRRSPSPDTRSVRSRFSSDEENRIPSRPGTPYPRDRQREPRHPRLPLIERLESPPREEVGAQDTTTSDGSDEFFNAVSQGDFCLHCITTGHNFANCPVRVCMYCQQTAPGHVDFACPYRDERRESSRSQSPSPVDRYELLYPDEGDGES